MHRNRIIYLYCILLLYLFDLEKLLSLQQEHTKEVQCTKLESLK